MIEYGCSSLSPLVGSSGIKLEDMHHEHCKCDHYPAKRIQGILLAAGFSSRQLHASMRNRVSATFGVGARNDNTILSQTSVNVSLPYRGSLSFRLCLCGPGANGKSLWMSKQQRMAQGSSCLNGALSRQVPVGNRSCGSLSRCVCVSELSQ